MKYKIKRLNVTNYHNNFNPRMIPKRKVIRSTNFQIRTMINFMASNLEFANTHFSLSREEYLEKWETLRAKLAMYGPDKSVEQWRHTWRDLKKRARQDINRAQEMQDESGDSSKVVATLSDTSASILEIIGSADFERVDDSDVVDDNDKHKVRLDARSPSPLPMVSMPSATSSYPSTFESTVIEEDNSNEASVTSNISLFLEQPASPEAPKPRVNSAQHHTTTNSDPLATGNEIANALLSLTQTYRESLRHTMLESRLARRDRLRGTRNMLWNL